VSHLEKAKIVQNMNKPGIEITELPRLKKPLLIAGFDGWGNALKISSGMAAYLVRKLAARQFAKISPDAFYRYDEARPLVVIEDGVLKSLAPPGGVLYAAKTAPPRHDVVILKADEPSLSWFQFIDEMFSLCSRLGVKTIITIGSMYDNVLHTDRIVSGVASTNELIAQLKEKNVNSINYQGPTAIHSLIQSEGPKKGFQCLSLWCHCPFYLQGTTHFGILSHLGLLLSFLGEFALDTQDLEESWKGLNEQIQELIKTNTEIKTIIDELRKSKVRGSSAGMKGAVKTDEKVINISDFLNPR
jgi:proteasome assembly chaperone (PAC2) family protein